MANDPSTSYDLKFTCPLARWRELASNHLSYGIEDLKPCAVISDGDGKALPWIYHVKCAVHGRIFSSRKATRAACFQEVSFWLESDAIHCPGHTHRAFLGGLGVFP